MTKFEEEFDEKIMTHKDNLDLMKVRKHFKDWHSDEQFQKLLEQNADWSQECKNINRVNAQLTKENEDLKSQLQQQALPVVPSFVADWYEFHMNGTFSAVITAYAFAGDDKAVAWLGQNGGMDLLCKMKLYGYTVEKTQLFYLREKNTNYYLNKSKNNGLELVPNPYFDEDNQFTQQEIDSMQTGSYEQISVPVEDGE